VLLGDDMLDLETRPIKFLRHAAIFAQSMCAVSDELCQSLIHATSS
jgi:hypothetical protein